MTIEIESAKALVRAVMVRDFTKVPTPSGKGDRVHLEVWKHQRTGLPIGFEMGHSTLVNVWLNRADLPASLSAVIKRTDKEPDGDGWTDDANDGANHNLKHYREFSGRPITRLALTNVAEALTVLGGLTRNEILSLEAKARHLPPAGAFLMKINGLLHAPGGVCRPRSASDWEGGTLSMPFEGKKMSSRYDMTPGPEIKPGDALYIWTHEDKTFGNGLGLTATAIAGQVSVLDDQLDIVLQEVSLLPHPFGFRSIEGKDESSKLLEAMRADRRLRCWSMSTDDQVDFDKLIESYGSNIAAAKAAAALAHLDPLDRAIHDNLGEIEEAEEERRTAVVKARPGQQKFRDEAMRRHKSRCVVTGFSVSAVLDAAHVIPHTGAAEFEVPENSLVLRRDIHALFDASMIAIDPRTSKLLVSTDLAGSAYERSLKDRFVDHKLAPASLRYQFNKFRSKSLSKVSS